MEINFQSNLKIIQSNSLVNLTDIKMFLKAGGFEDNSFAVNQLHQKVVEVPAAGSISAIDIFNFFGVLASDVTFIHIQVYNPEVDTYNLNDIRFSLTVGGVDLGDHSQFTLANIKNFNSSVVVDGITVPTDVNDPLKKGTLFIVVGTKI